MPSDTLYKTDDFHKCDSHNALGRNVYILIPIPEVMIHKDNLRLPEESRGGSAAIRQNATGRGCLDVLGPVECARSDCPTGSRISVIAVKRACFPLLFKIQINASSVSCKSTIREYRSCCKL